jgi:aryl-alcohol dehydrogenase-like predicted oxidoreductase
LHLPQRPIGSRLVSAVSLGCMNLSHGYGGYPAREDAARLVLRALDLGVTMLDTAALYGDGDNERLLGDHVMHRRQDFLLASKCVLGMFGGKRGLDGSPQAITQTLHEALRRLRTDHIDLYYLHRLDPLVPIEDSVGALVRAREAGHIGAIGLSEMSAHTLRRANAVHPIAAMQSEYSPVVRNPEVAVLDACREIGAAFVAFSPVARGLLAGAIRTDAYAQGDIRLSMPRFMQPQLGQNLSLVRRFERIAARADITPAQLSLAWLLDRAKHVIAIPGTRNEAHLRENLAAAARSVPTSVLRAVSDAFPANALRGPRYSRAAQAQIDTETLPDEELA